MYHRMFKVMSSRYINYIFSNETFYYRLLKNFDVPTYISKSKFKQLFSEWN